MKFERLVWIGIVLACLAALVVASVLYLTIVTPPLPPAPEAPAKAQATKPAEAVKRPAPKRTSSKPRPEPQSVATKREARIADSGTMTRRVKEFCNAGAMASRFAKISESPVNVGMVMRELTYRPGAEIDPGVRLLSTAVEILRADYKASENDTVALCEALVSVAHVETLVFKLALVDRNSSVVSDSAASFTVALLPGTYSLNWAIFLPTGTSLEDVELVFAGTTRSRLIREGVVPPR